MIRNRYILVGDLILIAVAAYGAFALRWDWLFFHHRPEFTAFLVAAVILKPLVFYPFGMYARYWRYASWRDALSIGVAVSMASMAMTVFVAFGRAFDVLPPFARPVILIDWLLTLATVGGQRVSLRVIADARRRAQKPLPQTAKRVLVVGAGEAGTLVIREMHANPQLGLQPVGFLDDASNKWGKRIHGVTVLGPLSSLPQVLARQKLDEVVIAMPRIGGQVVRNAAEACLRAGVVSRIVPGVFELLDGQVSVTRLRTVEIADLLRRRQVVARVEAADYLEGHAVLVTGAGGSIGSELCRQIAFSRPRRLVLLGHGENSIFTTHGQLRDQYPGLEIQAVIADVRDRPRIQAVFERWRPDVVFHAAAHKHVPLMEENPEEAVTNNVLGTWSVLQAAERSQVGRFVLISTDKAVEPTSIMGASKRVAEVLALSAAAESGKPYVVVRFGNVLGSRGSVVPVLQAQIDRGGPVTITHPDMKRFFMTIPEATHLVLQAGGIGKAGDLFVLNMGEQIRVVDLARDLIRLSGVSPDAIAITFTGVRPGEKLEEMLWAAHAKVETTQNPDVLRVQEHELAEAAGHRHVIEELIDAAQRGDRERLRLLLALAVPSYRCPEGAPQDQLAGGTSRAVDAEMSSRGTPGRPG